MQSLWLPDECFDFVDWEHPVNHDHPLNRDLIAWWLCVPGMNGHGTYTWRDIVRRPGYDAAMNVGIVPATDWQTQQAREGGWGATNWAGVSATYSASTPTIAHGVGTGDFTWSAWVRPGTVGTNYMSICSNGAFAPAMYVNVAGNFGFYWGADKPSGTALTANVWQHVIGMRRSSTLLFFVNGVPTPTTYGSFTTSMSNAIFYIAYDFSADPTLIGKLDDIRFHKSALSDSEAADLYHLSRIYNPGLLNRMNIWDYGVVAAAPSGNRRRRFIVSAA